MTHHTIVTSYFMFWYFLSFLAIVFILSGLDDLFFDVYYWIRYLLRLRKKHLYSPLTYEKMAHKEEQLIAILVPCWHEAGVIGTMLKHNCYAIDYKRYHIFVGLYPNDPHTIEEVQQAASLMSHIHCIIGSTPGPTNKASNLNTIYHYIRQFEHSLGEKFDIFVFHDSEDIIHPLSLKLYNYLIPRKDMIQIPVFPLAVSSSKLTHWLYADEFAEIHTKNIIVREAIKGHVPSAGVGTAFSRFALQVIEDPATKMPFSTDSLTEDYHTSLALRIHQLKPVFVTQKITKTIWQKRRFFRKGYEQKLTKEYIATRALFPLAYKQAVRQKTRWILGIVFQEWRQTRWPKEWRLRFTLAHDRKAFYTHFVNGFSYFIFLFWLLYSLLTYALPQYPSLQEQLNYNPWVWWLIVIATGIMMERMIQRFIAVKRVYYHWLPAFLSIPRTFYGNIVNLHALIRAYLSYYGKPMASSATPSSMLWDKTDHLFPGSSILTPYKPKLGDLLLKKKLLSAEQLAEALIIQNQTGQRLGTILCQKKYISSQKLLTLLSEQYQLPLVNKSQLPLTTNLNQLTKRTQRWLKENHIEVVSFDYEQKQLILGLDDPTNELLIERAINRTTAWNTHFVLIDKES